jgi:hypothetical protein
MDDDADLPDHDYASIYGHAALHARTLARLDALARTIEAQATRAALSAASSRAALGAMARIAERQERPLSVQDR